MISQFNRNYLYVWYRHNCNIGTTAYNVESNALEFNIFKMF